MNRAWSPIGKALRYAENTGRVYEGLTGVSNSNILNVEEVVFGDHKYAEFA
jgi:hypothetical protein